MALEDADLVGDASLFNEPDNYYPAEKSTTFVEHTVQSGQKLRLRLVGHNPLWVGSDPLLAIRPTH
jgi:nicotinamide N-methyltransferase